MTHPLKKHMNTEVTVKTPSGEDDWGKPTFSSERTIKAYRRSETITSTGTQGSGGSIGVITVTKDQLLTFDEVTDEDYLWLEGADTDNVDEAYQGFEVESIPSIATDNILYKITL